MLNGFFFLEASLFVLIMCHSEGERIGMSWCIWDTDHATGGHGFGLIAV